MSNVSTPAEARIRIAVKEELGSAATITRLKQHGDVVFLDVVAPLNLQKTEEAVLDALAQIGQFLENENVRAVEVNGHHRWVSSKPESKSQMYVKSRDRRVDSVQFVLNDEIIIRISPWAPDIERVYAEPKTTENMVRGLVNGLPHRHKYPAQSDGSEVYRIPLGNGRTVYPVISG